MRYWHHKAAGINRLPGRFLKDGANVLANSVTGICNISVSVNKFRSSFKLTMFKPSSKKRLKK